MAILPRDPQDGLEGSERVCAYCKEPIIFTDLGWLHRLALGRNCGLTPYPLTRERERDET